MADIILAPLNHAFIYVWADEAIERELSDEFSFVVPGAQYMSIYRKRNWDGKIRLFNRVTKTIYAGLTAKIERWAHKRGYTIENRTPVITGAWSGLDTAALIKQHPIPFEIRTYQEEAITHGLHRQRCVLISPTASGKSLILYYLVRARMSHGPLLLIVPTISLVSQMVEDWREYGWANVEQSVHSIRGGVNKNTDKPVVVSTWQSIFKQPESWFERYTTVLGDECVSPNTKISMSDGTTKDIKDISIGDLVKTVNESTKEIEDKPVLRIHHNLSKHERKYRVTLESGKQLIITGNHKVLLTSGEWKRVDNLKPAVDSPGQKIISIELLPADDEEVYNLHIQDNHNYFAEGVTVKNCHLYKAESLRGIMEKVPHCAVRIGVTGTLDDAKSNKLMVEGVFGPSYQVARTAELQTQGHLTPITVQAHFLQYGKHDKWMLKEHKRSYHEELDYLVQHAGRMSWLVEFVSRLSGNVLVLYTYVEKHGIPLYDAIRNRLGKHRPIYFVSGDIDADQRERVRALLERSEHLVIDFGELQVRCLPDEWVPLSDGRQKLAKDISVDDEVDDQWCRSNSGVLKMSK